MDTSYNLNWLLAQEKQGITLKYLYFWGHQPSKNGQITATCLSQWWEGHPFVVAGITYLTAEHWMMAQKAQFFGDYETSEKILVAKTPAEAKKLGRGVQNFDLGLWQEKCVDLVTQGNVHKFGQHEALKTFLLNTQNRVLVEASPFDKIWGIGLSADDPKAQHPHQWEGLNLLGWALMGARDVLRGVVS